jgi:hypothetical protein
MYIYIYICIYHNIDQAVHGLHSYDYKGEKLRL